MATLDEIWDGMGDGSMQRPEQAAILRVIVTRARSTVSAPDVEERLKALRVATVIGGPEAIGVYREYAADSHLEVRTAVLALATAAGELGLPAVRAMAKDPDPVLSGRVMALLFSTKDAQAGTVVRSLLADPQPLKRAWAALITGDTSGASMVMRVSPLLEDADPRVQAAAQWALAKMNGEPYGDPPIPGLSGAEQQASSLPVPVSPTHSTKPGQSPPRYDFEDILYYFKALGEASDPTELVRHIRSYDDDALSAGLRNASSSNITPAVKRGAAIAAARTENTRWAGTLRRLATDTHPSVRAAVAEALGALCTNGVSIALSHLLTDEEGVVRAAAARGLATGAPKIDSIDWAIQLLKEAAADPHADAKKAIEDALSTLQG